MKKIFYCPVLDLFHCLPLWKTVRLHGKKLQNATNTTYGALYFTSMLSSKVMPYLLRLAAPLMDSSIVHWTYENRIGILNPDILSHTSRHKEVPGWSQDRTEMIEESPFSTYTEHAPRKRKKNACFRKLCAISQKASFPSFID